MERAGPGLLLRDIIRDRDPQIAAAVQVIAALDADLVLLTGMDFDLGLAALGAFQARLAAGGAAYPYAFAFAPNSGVQTGLDIDGNGRSGDARDAQGYGRFAGAGGMALLSRLPIDTGRARDFSSFLWADLPGAMLVPDMPPDQRRVQRLSTTGHWDVPVILPDGTALHLMAWHATPPVFDGPEDRNGRRNHDEAAFWLRLLAHELPFAPPTGLFVLLGDANLDPIDGDGRPDALRALLAHSALQDALPRRKQGDGADGLDTVLYDAPLGGLRLDYVLPSRRLTVRGAGVLWPDGSDPLAPVLAVASRHRPVWVDVDLPSAP